MSDESQHPAFPPPPHPDVTLWRYLDRHKFDWLVNCYRLFMPATHFLGDDQLEGTAPAGHLEWWRIQAENAGSEEQRQIIEKNRKLILSFATAFRPNYYVSCWHMNEVESREMWQCYTKTTEAVAVKTTYRALRASLPAYVEIGMVRYLDYTHECLPSMNMFEYITHKDIKYCYEREVRAVAVPPALEELGSSDFRDNFFESETKKDCFIFAPEIDFSSLIHGVVLHPESTPEFAATVLSACEKVGLPRPVVSTFSDQAA